MTSNSGLDFTAAWADLHPAFRRCLDLAFDSLNAGGLAVGSVITSPHDGLVAEGHNRVYDEPGGDDVLQGSRLAHAEMNALAAVPTERSLDEATLWSTQFPCSMCRAAISFSGVPQVRYLADDPAYGGASREQTAFEGPGPSIWIVAADLLFLHNHIRFRGEDNEIVARNRVEEPEIVELTEDVVAESIAVRGAGGSSVEDFLASVWGRIDGAAAARDARRSSRA